MAGYGLRLAAVAGAYYVTAQLGLRLALVHGQVTPIWPPTGIAVIAFLLFGYRMWPAVALGALATNLPLGPTPVGAALIATGNTLASLAAAWLMNFAGIRLELDRLRDAGAVILGALGGMLVSASIGSAVLVVLGPVSASSFPSTWAVWWTGDAMGVLLVAPFLLCFRPRPGQPPLTTRERVELVALLAAVAVVTLVVFQTHLRLEYIVFPLIMAAALRFRLRGAAPAALIASGVAVWAAVNNTGPFTNESLLQKMVTLQVFNVFVALASFVLVAYVVSRDREQTARLSSEAKSDFLRVASHELRGPLSVLRGYITMLSSGDLGAIPERWRGPLDILEAKTGELSTIMDQLLEISRLDGDLSHGPRQVMDLRTIVDAAAERAQPRASLAGGSVIASVPPQAVTVRADRAQIGHVLDNLLNNAIAYSPVHAQVTLTLTSEDGTAVVRVADRGVGIDADLRRSLFEPFHRGRQAGVEDVAGTGLGLYISRELAAAQGGSLALEQSAPGAGSTFSLSLPIAVTETPRRP